MARFDKLIGIRKDEVGAEINDLRKLIQAVQDSIGSPTGIGGDLSVDASFPPIFTGSEEKSKVYVTLRYNIPGDTYNLKVVLVERDKALGDEDSYLRDRIKVELAGAIEDAQRAALTVTDRLDKPLKYNTQYDIIRLIANGIDGDQVASNPEATDFTGYPGNILYTFTTPEAFGNPSAPALVLIIVNELNPLTDVFDARVVVRVYAPTDDVGNPQTIEAAGVDRFIAVFQRVANDGTADPTAKPFQVEHVVNESELTQIDPTPPDGLGALSPYFNRGFVDIEEPTKIKAGKRYSWLKNIAWANGEKKVGTPGAPVLFYGAGLRPGTDGLPELTDFSFTASVVTNDANVRMAHLELDFRQSTPAIVLRRVKLAKKFQSEADSAYRSMLDKNIPLSDDRFHQPGLLISNVLANGGPITWDVPIRENRDYSFRANIVSIEEINFDISVNLDNTALNEPSLPSLSFLLSNELDPTTRKADALATFRVLAPLNSAGGAATWSDLFIKNVRIELVRWKVITGTVAISNGGTVVTGTGTSFLTAFKQGDAIRVGSEYKIIKLVVSDTSMNIYDQWHTTLTGQTARMGKVSRHGGPLSKTEQTQIDPTSTPANRSFVDITVRLAAGDEYWWTLNVVKGDEIESSSPVAPVAFFAGGKNTDLSTITGFSITSIVAKGTRKSIANVAFTQPATPVLLDSIELYERLPNAPHSEAAFDLEVEKRLIKSNDFQTTGAKTLILKAQHPKNTLVELFARLVSADGSTLDSAVEDIGAGDDDGAAVPGAMAAPVIITNTVDGDPETALARVSLSLPTADGLSFLSNNIGQVSILYARRNEANTAFTGDGIPEIWTIDDTSAIAVVKEFDARIGQRYRIFRISAINGDKITQAVVSVDFVAGGVLTVAPGDTYTVPAPTYQVAAAIDGNKHVTATVRLTQDGTNVVLFKKLVIQASTNGGAFEELFEIGLKAEDTLHLLATSFKDFPIRVHRKPSSSFQLRVFAVAVKGKLSANTDSAVLGAGLDDGAIVPAALVTAAVFANTVDGDPARKRARVSLTLTTANSPTTFAANSISSVELILTRLDASSVPTGDPFSQIKVLSTADLAAATCKHEFFLAQGDRFRILRVVSRNGDKRLESGALTTDFIAGGFRTDGTCPAPTFQANPAADGNKLASFTLRLVNTTPPVEFKNMTIQVSYTGSGGTYRDIEGSPVGLNSHDDLNVAGATKDFVFSVKRKAGATLDVRAIARMVGPVTSTTANATQLAASTDDVLVDTAAPGGLTTPTLLWADRGGIEIRGIRPTTNINTLERSLIVLTDNGGTPKYYDFITKALAANEAAARFDVGLKHHVSFPVKKKKLTAVFGTGAVDLFAYYYSENRFSSPTSVKSSDSAALALGSQQEYLSDDAMAVKVIDVSSLMSGPQNMVRNGEMGFRDAASSLELDVWRRWTPASNLTLANTQQITTTSSNIHWDQTNHAIVWDGEAQDLVQKIRSLVPGDYYSLTFMVKRTGTLTSPAVTVRLIKQGTTTDELEAIPTISLTNLDTAAYKMYGAVFRLATTADGGTAHWLALRTATDLSTSNFYALDRFMLCRGKQPFSFVPNSNAEVSPFSLSEDFDVSPASIGTSPDVGNPTGGTQGRWFGEGFGGEFFP